MSSEDAIEKQCTFCLGVDAVLPGVALHHTTFRQLHASFCVVYWDVRSLGVVDGILFVANGTIPWILRISGRRPPLNWPKGFTGRQPNARHEFDSSLGHQSRSPICCLAAPFF